MARLRLHHRIVVPFVLVALLTTSVAAYVARSVASGTLEARAKAQLLSAATVIGKSDLALNPAVLRTFKDATGADVVTFRGDGQILAATLDAAGRARVGDALRSAAASHRDDPERPTTSVRSLDCGVPCFVAIRPLEGRPDLMVALVAETADVAAAQTSITRSILLTALLSAIVIILVSQFVARRITAPLDRLVAFVQDVAPVESGRRAQVGRDEIGHLARAFNEMLDRLDRSRDALVKSEKLGLAGLMAAQVAHDIRNPLSSIKMQTQLVRTRLRRGSGDEAALTAVLHDVQQVESVIQDLLELARPGRMTLLPTDLNRVVTDVLRQLGPQLSHRRITVALALAGDLPMVALDAERFKRALVNVLVNASDAMPTGGTVEVVTRSDESRTAVEVEVIDDGAGIDPAIRDRVFDPFLSTKRDGIGLGLVNVKSVVQSHGGSVSLHPNEPKGTRAVIRLPVEPVSGAQTAGRNTDG